ncbi:hypothetical protein C2869_04580 [Saccharobesus litoralis]|uniref:Response regulatory domain-containing protein n=1 Tax=Saccharobesus litoralis TaxID=2172099 RepID=A0A2S0VNI3_9ALTE|nr:response regulator [Saccharobesus litoralis]AWB65756.1 hypothetical protein C2869_04580 [Saccharobesus litoralis]
MFLPFEATFIINKLEKEVEQNQQKLTSELNDSQRTEIEQNIIIAIACITKLQKELPAKATNRPAKVLVVDDVETMRQVNKHLLLDIGFENIDVAINGHDALVRLQQALDEGSPYDLVISDWEMPKMSGMELLKHIKTSPLLWRTHLYLLTGLSEKQDVMTAIKAGVSGYMTKPVNQKILKNKLAYYL